MVFPNALTLARSLGRCWKMRPPTSVFNTSLGTWQMLMHEKPCSNPSLPGIIATQKALFFRKQNMLLILFLGKLIVLGFNGTSTLVGHFMLSPREREKRDKRDTHVVEEVRDRGERKRNESEETEEIKSFPLYFYLLQGLPNCKPISYVVGTQ